MRLTRWSIRLIGAILHLIGFFPLLYRHLLCYLYTTLINNFSGLLFVLFRVEHCSLRIYGSGFFRCTFTSVVHDTRRVVSYPITMITTDMNIFPFGHPNSTCYVRFMTTIPAGRRPKGRIGFVGLYQTLPNNGPLLYGFGNFFVGREFIDIKRRVPFFLQILFHLFQLVECLMNFPNCNVPWVLFPYRGIMRYLVQPIMPYIRL